MRGVLSVAALLGAAAILDRHPLKKLAVDEAGLLRQLERWRDEAAKAGRRVTRLAVAFEAGRDGFWLARWLRARGVEAHVIHPTSVAVSREHRRAKTDRLDTELLKRAFLGRLRGEPGHCSMAAVPTLEEEDARRPSREREALVAERTRVVNRVRGRLARLVHGELLEWVAVEAGDDGRDEPARLAHLDHRDQRALGVEGGAAPARVVRHWHGGLHRLGPAAMVLRLAARPIASRTSRRDDESGR